MRRGYLRASARSYQLSSAFGGLFRRHRRLDGWLGMRLIPFMLSSATRADSLLLRCGYLRASARSYRLLSAFGGLFRCRRRLDGMVAGLLNARKRGVRSRMAGDVPDAFLGRGHETGRCRVVRFRQVSWARHLTYIARGRAVHKHGNRPAKRKPRAMGRGAWKDYLYGESYRRADSPGRLTGPTCRADLAGPNNSAV